MFNLPVEILLDIAEHLDLRAIISFAQIHSHARSVVDKLMKKLLSNKPIKITGAERCLVRHAEERLNFGQILYFFRNFGHHLTHLTINGFGYTNEQRELFLSYIRTYAAEYLKEIDFNFNQSFNPLMNFNGSFPQAKTVCLKEVPTKIGSKIREIFPSCESLDVEESNLNNKLFAVNFPNLKGLVIPYAWGYYERDFDIINETLYLNPQIKHLSIYNSFWRMVQIFNEMRPDLESLNIKKLIMLHSDDRSHTLRFPSMKKLKMLASRNGGMQRGIDRIPLEFGNLEEIEFNREDLIEHWIEIVLQNKKLKKIVTRDFLTNDQLERIENGLPKLETFLFIFDYNADMHATNETIRFLMETSYQIKEVSFNYLDEHYCKYLRDVLTEPWKPVENIKSMGKSNEFCNFVRRYA